jgi:hypothetical protein
MGYMKQEWKVERGCGGAEGWQGRGGVQRGGEAEGRRRGRRGAEEQRVEGWRGGAEREGRGAGGGEKEWGPVNHFKIIRVS